MSFVRSKTFSGKSGKKRTYYYLVQDVREDGHVRQRVIAYLGRYPTLKDAIAGVSQNIEQVSRRLERTRQNIAELEPQIGSDPGRLAQLARTGNPTERRQAGVLKEALECFPRHEKQIAQLQGWLADLRSAYELQTGGSGIGTTPLSKTFGFKEG